MQALILVGGEGTRLRPLTSTMPKPVVPLVDRPFIAFMLDWLGSHGVDDVVLSCGFLAGGVRQVLGERYQGIRLRYVEEPQALGTGGALKFAQELLDERFFMLNGDVLCDIDLTAQLELHERSGARATIALVAVEDPSAYGLVRLNADGSVREFLEKPAAEQIDTDLINAGAYIIEREVLGMMPPPGTTVSIEREVFPRLVGEGLFAVANPPDTYWLDIGTPQRYLQGTFDILEGRVGTRVGEQIAAAGFILTAGASVLGRLAPPLYAAPGARIAEGAVVGGRVVLAAEARIEAGAHVEDSVILAGSHVGAGSRLSGVIVGPGCRIGSDCRLEGGVVLGAGVQLGSANTLAAGARIFPDVRLPDRAISF